MDNIHKLNMIKAAIYLRVSTHEQAKNGHGLDFQLEECQRLCYLKRYNVYKIYRDEGVSGTTEVNDRIGFKELLNDAEAGKFKVVVFYSFDRLGRTTRIIQNIFHFLDKTYQIEIISCKEEVDTTTAQGRFYLNIHGSIAELELDTIKTRMRLGKEQKRKLDGYTGGRLPYGYVKINNEIAIDEHQGSIVIYIFDLYQEGHTLNKISTILNHYKVPPPRAKHWSAAGVTYIFKHKDKYVGGVINNNENDVRWPKILTDHY